MFGKSDKKCSIRTPVNISNMEIFLFHHNDGIVAVPAHTMIDAIDVFNNSSMFTNFTNKIERIKCELCIENESILDSLKQYL